MRNKPSGAAGGKQKLTVPTTAEMRLLQILWDLKEATVDEVVNAHPEKERPHYKTTQTLLRIMEDKGLIRHRAEGRTFIYEPIYSRDRVTARLLHRVFDGALDQVVLSLLQAKDATEEELRGMEQMISEARKRKASRNNRKTEGK